MPTLLRYVVFLFFLLILPSSPTTAQSAYEILVNDMDGKPSTFIAGGDGYLYTTTPGSLGNGGGIFRMTPGGAMTMLHWMPLAAGLPRTTPLYPSALVRASSGYFYGTTRYGGDSDCGTVFRISVEGAFLVLHSFTPAEGWMPLTGVIEGSDGSFYGTTSRGGTSDAGTVFRMAPDGTLATLASFASGAPSGLIEVDGALYGTTSGGGTSGLGVIFRLTLDGSYTVLHDFTEVDGGTPFAALVFGGGDTMFGTTSARGQYGFGSAFRITVGGAYTTLHHFSASDGGRAVPALLWASDGNFYGSAWTTSSTDPEPHPSTVGVATVFRMTRDGALTVLTRLEPRPVYSESFFEFEGALYAPVQGPRGNRSHGRIIRITLPELPSSPRPLHIRTVAGTGIIGSMGDGMPARAAQLAYPYGLAVDSAGNLFIADAGAHRIRKVAAGTGIISTVAGTGSAGYMGDGGPAANAKLYGPSSVAVDQAGNLYIADTWNFRIRKIAASSGVITTIAGDGVNGYDGDGGPAITARLSAARGVAVDRTGNLYIADTGNNRIRKVDPEGTITTFAGGAPLSDSYVEYALSATSTQLLTPARVAVEPSGDVLIVDMGHNQVRRVTVSTGTIATVLGVSVPQHISALASPRDVAVDAAGNIYVADGDNYRIRKITPMNVVTIAGSGSPGLAGDEGPATSVRIQTPYAVAVDLFGSVYIADPENGRVRKAEQNQLARAPSDFDGDGGADIVWSNAISGAIEIWKMNGTAVASSISAGTLPSPAWQIAATADFNGDGHADLLLRNRLTGENEVWLMRDAQHVGDAPLDTVADLSWIIAGAADFNLDGRPDILWRNAATGRNIIWYMSGMSYLGYAELDPVAGREWVIGGAADFDGDGDPDVLWRSARTGQNILWLLDGTNRVGERVVVANTDLDWTIAIVADFNGDSRPDIVWRNYATGQNAVWFMNGADYLGYAWLPSREDTTWTLLERPPGPLTASSDFNGDGKPDILWRNSTTGENRIWYMYNATRVGDVNLDTVADTNWTSVASGDFNGDGKPDIFWRNAVTGQNIVWFMNGATYQSYAWLDVVPAEWRLAGVADFDRDGRVDLLWRNAASGVNIIWYMNGTKYVSYAYVDTVADVSWQIAGAADFNSDGKPDLFWRNTVTGENAIWYMNNAAFVKYTRVVLLYTVSLEPVADPTWSVAMVADFNGDDKPDVLWRNRVTGENLVWYLNGSTYVSYARLDNVADSAWRIGQEF